MELKTGLLKKNKISSMALLKNGKLASGCSDATIKIWDLNTGTLKTNLSGHKDNIWALELLSTGDLASGSSDKTIKIWNLNDYKLKITLTGHKDWILALKSML